MGKTFPDKDAKSSESCKMAEGNASDPSWVSCALLFLVEEGV
jgi:hypothetical protein